MVPLATRFPGKANHTQSNKNVPCTIYHQILFKEVKFPAVYLWNLYCILVFSADIHHFKLETLIYFKSHFHGIIIMNHIYFSARQLKVNKNHLSIFITAQIYYELCKTDNMARGKYFFRSYIDFGEDYSLF